MERGDSSREGSSRDYSRIILSLAGVVQAILQQRARGLSPPSNRVANTQEYVQRALEEPTEDDTFRKNPWLKVVNYGYLEMEEWNPIATLIPRNGPGQPALVVGILESMTPVGGTVAYNGCYLCVIKDHTGKIGGNIHYKIFNDEKWEGKIVPGVALILTSIVVFRPTRNSAYLNITLNNLYDVIVAGDE